MRLPPSDFEVVPNGERLWLRGNGLRFGDWDCRNVGRQCRKANGEHRGAGAQIGKRQVFAKSREALRRALGKSAEHFFSELVATFEAGLDADPGLLQAVRDTVRIAAISVVGGRPGNLLSPAHRDGPQPLPCVAAAPTSRLRSRKGAFTSLRLMAFHIFNRLSTAEGTTKKAALTKTPSSAPLYTPVL
jgi:hypothetical protein